MRKKLLYAVFGAMNLVLGASSAQAAYDYTWAYNPIDHSIVLVCESCWFWSCDC